MPRDGFASGAGTPSARARGIGLAFLALVGAVALVSSQGTPRIPGGSSSATIVPLLSTSPGSSLAASPSRAPSASDASVVVGWAVAPDRSGLAEFGTPVGLAWGAEGIVATGTAGVAWSKDGTSWEAVTNGPVDTPVVATPGGYFALGDGVGWTSADGRSWTTVEAREASGFAVRGIDSVGSTLVAIGTLKGSSASWAAAFTSTDGWTWGREAGILPPFDGLVASDGTVVATVRVEDGGRQTAVRRPDGTWSDPRPIGLQVEIEAVGARAGSFVAVGTEIRDGRQTGAVWSSSDGSTWTLLGDPGIAGTPTAIALTDTGMVLAARDPTGFWSSPDGTAWRPTREVPSFTAATPTVIAAAGDRVVALGASVAQDGSAFAWTSPPAAPEPVPPAADTSMGWARVGSLPQTSEGDRLVALRDGSLLLLGGAHAHEGGGIEWLIGVWRRDTSGRWSERSPMPQARGFFVSTVAADGRVWVVGGVRPDEGTSTRQVGIYDPVADRWSSGPELPPDTYPTDAVAMPDGSVIAVMSATELWQANAGDAGWRQMAAAPGPAGYAATGALLRDGRLLVVTPTTIVEPDPTNPGTTRDRLLLTALAIDPSTGAWERRRAPSAGAPSSGVLVRLGDGRLALAVQTRVQPGAGGGQVLRRVDVYDEATDSWSLLTNMPAGRQAAGVAVDPAGRLWVAGGETEMPDVGTIPPTADLLVWTPPDPRPGGP